MHCFLLLNVTENEISKLTTFRPDCNKTFNARHGGYARWEDCFTSPVMHRRGETAHISLSLSLYLSIYLSTQCHQGLFKCWYFFLSHYDLQLACIVVTWHWWVYLGGSIETPPSLATGLEVNTASSADSTETGYPGFYPPLAFWHRQN